MNNSVVAQKVAPYIIYLGMLPWCRYDPVLDQYTNLSSLPEPRTRGGADILGGLLYYVGGYTSADDSGRYLLPSEDCTLKSNLQS